MFAYLGSTLSYDCADNLDVENRIDKAGQAFCTLRKNLFASTQITLKTMPLAYCILILTVLLYGSETWCLTEALYRQLRNFHVRCVRTMCRVTCDHTHAHRISTAQLLDRLGLPSIDTFITKRQLRWAGHVSRMDYDRLTTENAFIVGAIQETTRCSAPYVWTFSAKSIEESKRQHADMANCSRGPCRVEKHY